MKQLHLWTEDNWPPPQDTGELDHAAQPEATPDPFDDLVPPSAASSKDYESAVSLEQSFGPPAATPLPSAIEAGVFGMTLDGPIVPDNEQVEQLTAEHANEMIVLLADSQVLEDATRLEYDPATGRTPSTPEAKQSLLARLDKEWKRFLQAYDDAIRAYSEGFGDSAAKALDEWVRKTVADADQRTEPYPPTHPWHYFHAGDNAPPAPVDQIVPDLDAGRRLAERLPKNRKKRLQVMGEMLEREQTALESDKKRYTDIVLRGAEALNRFDREIAHTSDAMAVATALSLKYSHISQGLGRIAWFVDRLRSSVL